MLAKTGKPVNVLLICTCRGNDGLSGTYDSDSKGDNVPLEPDMGKIKDDKPAEERGYLQLGRDRYALEDLSATASKILASIKFVDAGIRRIEAEQAISETAKSAYVSNLRQEVTGQEVIVKADSKV